MELLKTLLVAYGWFVLGVFVFTPGFCTVKVDRFILGVGDTFVLVTPRRVGLPMLAVPWRRRAYLLVRQTAMGVWEYRIKSDRTFVDIDTYPIQYTIEFSQFLGRTRIDLDRRIAPDTLSHMTLSIA